MSDATSTTPGEVLVDVTAPTGTHPTALTTYGWLNDSTAPYVDSGAAVSGVGNVLTTGITGDLAPGSGRREWEADHGQEWAGGE